MAMPPLAHIQIIVWLLVPFKREDV